MHLGLVSAGPAPQQCPPAVRAGGSCIWVDHADRKRLERMTGRSAGASGDSMKVDLFLTGRYGWGITHGGSVGGLAHPAWTVSECSAGGLTRSRPVEWPPPWRQKTGGLGLRRRGATLLRPGRQPHTAPMTMPLALWRYDDHSQVAVPVEEARMRDVHCAEANVFRSNSQALIGERQLAATSPDHW